MDIWTVLRTSLRRWYVFVPVLALSLGLGYSMAQDLDPVYTAESSAILVAPAIVPGQEEGEMVEVNPYLNLGGGLTTTTQVTVVLMNSGPKRLEYFDLGLEPDYAVDRVDAVMYFTVTGTDPESVTATANELVVIADDEVAELQDKSTVRPEERIRVRPLSLPQVAIEDGGAGIQLMAILGVLGLVAGVGAAVALDGFLQWRRERRSPDEPSGGGERSRKPAPRSASSSRGPVRFGTHRRPGKVTRASEHPDDGPETLAGPDTHDDAAQDEGHEETRDDAASRVTSTRT